MQYPTTASGSKWTDICRTTSGASNSYECQQQSRVNARYEHAIHWRWMVLSDENRNTIVMFYWQIDVTHSPQRLPMTSIIICNSLKYGPSLAFAVFTNSYNQEVSNGYVWSIEILFCQPARLREIHYVL